MSSLFNNGVTRLVRDLRQKFARIIHTHAASDITSGTLAVARGGTGAGTALDARKSLGVPSDSSIAPVESTTATSNHASGDYFMLGSVLMKATRAIAAGEQITTSNATPATLQGQIDTLRDSVGRLNMRTAEVTNMELGYNPSIDAMQLTFTLSDSVLAATGYRRVALFLKSGAIVYRTRNEAGQWTDKWSK